MKKPRPIYGAGDVVENGHGWKRRITLVMTDYNEKKGTIGYMYKDDFGVVGICSQEHLRKWGQRYA